MSMETAMTLADYEQIHPNVEYTLPAVYNGESENLGERLASKLKLRFLTPNQHCAWRVSTLDSKEPDTIEWLLKMQPGETLFDVGANMGQYALIAARLGLTVHAFEPESQNFALLCRNIALNDLGERVTAWPIALSDDRSIAKFYVQSLQAGGSCSSYGESVNFHLQPKKYAVTQGSMAIEMTRFALQFGYPDHVKIDVDGLEHDVVDGMIHPDHSCSVLKTVKSVLVELNTALPEHLAIYDIMEKHGLEPDTETADKARRTEGAFAGIGNVIFYRKQP